MSLVITARFLLGAYQGRDASGEPERYPTPDRLFKALLSVACSNFGYHSSDCTNEDDIEATLRWLEGNPPDKILLPLAIESTGLGAVAYRDKGFTVKGDKTAKGEQLYKLKMASAPALRLTRYESQCPVEWHWIEQPPSSITSCLEDLCEEIPYLGESCSKAHVSAQIEEEGPEAPASRMRTLIRDEAQGLQALNSHQFFTCPGDGRLEELEQNFALVNSGKDKNPKGDVKKELSAEETNLLSQMPRASHVLSVAYRSADSAEQSNQTIMPAWDRSILLPMRIRNSHEAWSPRESELVRWSVALHRFLVKKWGFGAPAILTGRYMKVPGMMRPANNLAIQVLSAAMGVPIVSRLREDIQNQLPAFLLLIPREMTTDDYATLCDLCANSVGERLYCGHDSDTLVFGKPICSDDTSIWKVPEAGRIRFWKPWPFAMAETRAFADPQGLRKWRATESLALSINHVWRRAFVAGTQVPTSHVEKEQAYWSAADAVLDESSPVEVLGAKPAFRTHMEDYAHHVQESNVLRGVSGLIHFDPQRSDVECSAMAIGQTRHLGGGLLVPIDVPQDLLVHNPANGKEEPVWLN